MVANFVDSIFFLVDAIQTMMKEFLVHVGHLIVLSEKSQFSKTFTDMYWSKAFFGEIRKRMFF